MTDGVDPLGDRARARRPTVCRTTIASTPMASMVSTVSRSDSPFLTDDVLTLKFIVSAESRLAAVSNDSRVRVESS